MTNKQIWWGIGIVLGIIVLIWLINMVRNNNTNANIAERTSAVRCCFERDVNCRCTKSDWIRRDDSCPDPGCPSSTSRVIIPTRNVVGNGGNGGRQGYQG